MPDDVATISSLKQKVQRFCEDRNWDQFHSPKDLAIGIITEAGELIEPFRFKSEKETEAMLQDKEKREYIGEELADVLYFVLRFAQKYGFDLSEELDMKLELNSKRYPVEKSYGSNKKYGEL